MVLSGSRSADRRRGVGRAIHVVPPNGGGVDRFVRDLCRHRPADWILHVSDTQCVMERPTDAHFLPVDSGTFADLAFCGALGRPQLVHAHSTTAAVRRATELVCATTHAPRVLTLHDIGFSDPAVPAHERDQRLRFARAAAIRTAPSHYIADLATQVLGQHVPCHLVANGVDPWPNDAAGDPAPAAARSVESTTRFAIAVIGAIGEHKGLSALLEMAACLPQSLRMVIIGYTAQQLVPGWVVPGRVWMHGVFEPRQLPGLVAHYGVQLAFFPPGMPESYSYALSDAWMAQLPALAPDRGALAERLRLHGGGRLYDPHLPAAGIAACVAAWAADGTSTRTGMAAPQLASVQEMVDAMTTIYEGCSDPTTEVPADQALINSLAQKHLDTQFFRKELLHLQNLLAEQAQAQAGLARRTADLEAALVLEQARAQTADQLRVDLAAQQQACLEVQHRLDAAQAEQQAAAQALAALQTRQDSLQSRYEILQARHRSLTGKLTKPLRWLPPALRDRLIDLGRRWMI